MSFESPTENPEEEEYVIWFAGCVIKADSPFHAAHKALEQGREPIGLMIDRVVDSKGIVRMALDTREVGKPVKELDGRI